MGLGSSGGVKKSRLPVFLIYFTIACIVLLALGACGGEDPTPVPAAPAPPVAMPVPPAPPVQLLPTQPPAPFEQPAAQPQSPVSTPLVVVPGGRFTSRVPAAQPTVAPSEEPKPATLQVATPTPSPTLAPTATIVVQPVLPTETPLPVRNPSISITPGSGQPGTDVTVAGTDFVPGSPVGAVSFGGVSVSPNPPVGVDSLGSFFAVIVVPNVAAGSYNLTFPVGSDSPSTTFVVQAAPSGPVVPSNAPIVSTLAPLAGNLQWVAFFENDTKSWSLYDPTGTFTSALLPVFLSPPANPGDYTPLTSIDTGLSYHWNLQQADTVQIAGKEYEFEAGYNLK